MKSLKTKPKKFLKENIRKTPEEPGVYIYSDKDKNTLYIGKSNNLRRRIESYLSSSVTGKTKILVNQIEYFETIVVNSDLEALLLEAELVGKYKPPFNIQLKDDKHPLYIKITKDKYPSVLTARKRDLKKNDTYFGPFPRSSNVKYVLKLLRRIFPFSQHKVGKRPCLYSQIGLCNPCPNVIENITNKKGKQKLRRQYLGNIRSIKAVLSGRIKYVKRDLEKQMKKYSKNESYEEAKTVKNKIDRLNYITQPIIPAKYYIENPNLIDEIRFQETEALANILNKFISIPSLKRIECFDVAHLAGDQPTASMVTFINGEADKYLYRHFKIRQKKGDDDIASLSEVGKRRKKYLSTWGVPDLIIVDGGKVQAKAFKQIFSDENIAVVGLAKRQETLVFPIKKDHKYFYKETVLKRGPALNLVQRLRNEAHRFARRYHHHLLKKQLLGSVD
jgi:excinuclease ABC subunit C